MEPDITPELTALVHALEQARTPSYPLTLEVRRLVTPATGDLTPTLDALAAAAGYKGLGAGWIEIPRRIAAKILTHIVGGELAYPEEVLPDEEAAALAARFLDLFPAPAHYFTNGAVSGDYAVYDSKGEEVLGWRSLSEAPLDNGVIAISGNRVGLLWAEDAP